MKSFRFTCLVAAAMALQSSAFAFDAATIFSLEGQVKVTNGEVTTLAAVGNDLPTDGLIQSGVESLAGVKLPDGSTQFLDEATSIRMRFSDNGKKSEIVLIKGAIAGDYTNATVNVVTSAGKADLSGTASVVAFQPNQTGGGKGKISVVKGVAVVSPKGSSTPVKVPAGSSISFGDGDLAPGTLSEDEVIAAAAATKGGFAGKSGAKKTTGGTGSTTSAATPDLGILSPNGEGATN